MDLSEYLKDIRQRYGVRRIAPSIASHFAEQVFIMTADAMLDWTGKRYDYDTMKPYIDKLLGWALCSSECGLDLTRGILFKGGTGKGKTFMLQVFKEWLGGIKVEYTQNGKVLRMELTIANARTIASEYSKPEGGGTEIIEKYSRVPMLLIDDIGAESKEQNSYGNRVNVINDILDKRQERNLLTFGTTNFDKLTAEAGYDDRMKRRINALFNIVSINHDKKY